jgi:hypothetical protein
MLKHNIVNNEQASLAVVWNENKDLFVEIPKREKDKMCFMLKDLSM